MDDRLYRSPTERVIAGVAGGMATWLNLDPSLVRVAWVLLGVVSGGLFVLVYIVMMIIVPLPPPGWTPRPRGTVGAPGSVPGWQAGGGATWAPPAGTPPVTEGEAGPPGSPPPPGSAPAAGWSTPSPAWVPPRVESGNAGIVFGAVLVLLGSWFLVDRYLNVDWQLLWPLFVIGLGIVVILGTLLRGRAPGG